MIIIKRDGRIEEFNENRIIIAIEKAMAETELGIDTILSDKIAKSVSSKIKNNTDVEKIQDYIEEKLMTSNRKDVAKRYILYREEHNKLRKEPKWDMNEMQQAIWDNKYKYNDETFNQWLVRISGGNEEIIKMILHKKFLYAGRILAGRGTNKDGRKVTMSNCFVLPSPKDNIESIFDTAKEMARTYSWGGGVGIDISNLRPNNAKVNNASESTSGAISFMNLYSATTELIGQRGRRGALMITISDTHPDLIDFINCKTDLGAVTKANISFKISDAFMKAVDENKEWELYFDVIDTNERISKMVNAKDVYHLFCKNDWNYAEPSAVFWDRIVSWHLMSEDEFFEYVSLNPCAEEPLPEYGSCNLSSLNLSEFIDFPFTDKSIFNYEKFDDAVRKAVIAMNEILDESIENHMYPLEQQRQVVIDYRQIGIGIMGLADMLIKLGIRYGSKKSIELCDSIGFKMINSALQQSSIYAKEHGVFKKYRKEAILKSPFLKYNATSETIKLIEEYGLANSQILTIAPTGSLSSLLGISGGIEPIFANYYERKTESLHDEETIYKVYTPIVKEYMDRFNIKDDKDLPNFFITSQNLNFLERIDMQSVWQNHIDASISSTVNLPFATSVKNVEDLYMYAWEKGLKGITIFRDGCKRAGILTIEGNEEDYEKVNQVCPECGCNNMIKANGCSLCLECGYSPCL